jgi:hypothetical protein
MDLKILRLSKEFLTRCRLLDYGNRRWDTPSMRHTAHQRIIGAILCGVMLIVSGSVGVCQSSPCEGGYCIGDHHDIQTGTASPSPTKGGEKPNPPDGSAPAPVKPPVPPPAPAPQPAPDGGGAPSPDGGGGGGGGGGGLGEMLSQALQGLLQGGGQGSQQQQQFDQQQEEQFINDRIMEMVYGTQTAVSVQTAQAVATEDAFSDRASDDQIDETSNQMPADTESADVMQSPTANPTPVSTVDPMIEIIQ